MPFKSLTDKDITIELYKDEYLDDLYEYRSQKNVNQFYSIIPENKNHLGAYLNEHITPFDSPGNYCVFVILKNRTVIGEISLKSWGEDNENGGIGFALNPDFWGQGIAKQAVHLFTESLFREYGKIKIQAEVNSRNTNSIYLLKTLNFTQTHHLKNTEQVNGQRQDTLVFTKYSEQGK